MARRNAYRKRSHSDFPRALDYWYGRCHWACEERRKGRNVIFLMYIHAPRFHPRKVFDFIMEYDTPSAYYVDGMLSAVRTLGVLHPLLA